MAPLTRLKPNLLAILRGGSRVTPALSGALQTRTAMTREPLMRSFRAHHRPCLRGLLAGTITSRMSSIIIYLCLVNFDAPDTHAQQGNANLSNDEDDCLWQIRGPLSNGVRGLTLS